MKAELIGKKIEIVKSNNKCLESISGKIIDETKNTIISETPRGRKTMLKNNSIFRINNEIVSGNSLASRPEERIKSNGK